MTLFWHAHFGISNRKVARYALMQRHIETLRAHATGNFGDLLDAVTVDPAMLVFLDGRKNTKTDTNENYAREIMELFALGVGNYTEADIKEAARALTGYSVHGLDVTFERANFDAGRKTILGETGNFDAEDVTDILLRQDAAARFLAGKLYRYFANEGGDAATEEALATVLREADYELKPFLRTLFLSKDFYAPGSYATKIKSPVDLVVGTTRKLGLDEMPGVPRVLVTLGSLGQVPLDPPSVKGWDRGRNWVTPSNLFERANFARHLLFAEEAQDKYHPYRRLLDRHHNSVENAALVDRRLALTAAGAGDKLAAADMQDMMGMASVSVAAATQEYDLRIGVKNGWIEAWKRIPPTHPTHAPVTAANMLFDAKVKTAEEALDYYAARFLRMPLEGERRAEFVTFARSLLGTGEIDYLDQALETQCRELIHALMSTPEYQLS